MPDHPQIDSDAPNSVAPDSVAPDSVAPDSDAPPVAAGSRPAPGSARMVLATVLGLVFLAVAVAAGLGVVAFLRTMPPSSGLTAAATRHVTVRASVTQFTADLSLTTPTGHDTATVQSSSATPETRSWEVDLPIGGSVGLTISGTPVEPDYEGGSQVGEPLAACVILDSEGAPLVSHQGSISGQPASCLWTNPVS